MTTDEELTRTTFDDATRVLAARTRLDELALDVLTSPGLAQPQTMRLRAYLEGDHLRAGHDSLRRLERICASPTLGGQA